MNILQCAFVGDISSASAGDAMLTSADGRTAMHYAVAGGDHVACVEALGTTMEPKLVNTPDSSGVSPVELAVYCKRAGAVSALLALGASRAAALCAACRMGDPSVVEALLTKEGCQVDGDAMHAAAASSNVEVLRVVLDVSVLEARNDAGATPLLTAAASGCLEAVSLLLEKGAELHACDAQGSGALHYAAQSGSREVVDALLAAGLAPDLSDRTGSAPLHMAAVVGDVEVSRTLMLAGAVPGADEEGDTPLDVAAFYGHAELVQLLLRGQSCDNALLKACHQGHAEVASVLLDQGHASVTATTPHDETCLHLAAFSGNLVLVHMLLKAGAARDALDAEQATALHKAAFCGHVSITEEFIDLASLTDVDGALPLHMASAAGSSECAHLLASAHPISVSKTTAQNWTPLHYAARAGSIEALKALLAAKADTQQLTDKGLTALDVAVRGRHFEAARLLQEAGCGGSANSLQVLQQRAAHSPSPSPLLVQRKTSKVDPAAQRAVTMFNQKGRKALQLVVAQKLAEDNAASLAYWLFHTEGLSKRQVGEVLSDSDELAQQMTEEFLLLMDFKGLAFDVALRHFLAKFRLPGEAQKIDRVVELFAARYYDENPESIFANADTAYVLAFAVIMLNTDLFNPSVKKEKKMTKEQWVNHVRGVNDGQDLPRDFVIDLYERIRTNEIKMETEGSVYGNAEKKGFCIKQGGKIRTWKKRYFVLAEHQLIYMKKSTDATPLGIIPLENLTVEADNKATKFGVKLVSTEGTIKSVKIVSGGAVSGNHSSFLFGAPNAEEQKSWIDTINREIHRSPFYELLLKKKKKT